jgi:hypothetical protein
VQLQRNRLAAQTFDDMHKDHDKYVVPVDGAPNNHGSSYQILKKELQTHSRIPNAWAKMQRIAALGTSVINS